MRLYRISPSIVVLGFMIGVIVLGVISRSFLGDGFWSMNDEFGFVNRTPTKGPGFPPIFAYWISGSGGENERILRLLKAVYHPRNRYLLHLDAGSLPNERLKLAQAIQSERLFRAFGNVEVVGKSYAVERMGSSALAAMLHGAAILLKINNDWDWFITLSAADYPIVSQDDLLHVFASLPRDLNFIDHTSDLGWKEADRINKIVVDPSLYFTVNSPLFEATEPRVTPDAFNIFTGSPWVILSRPFTEHCVHSWDNLPRKLLMYTTNMAFPLETYFQTIICNTPEFRNTTVNNDLRYFVWDNPPKLDPLFLNISYYEGMTKSRAAIARRFTESDPVLQKLDEDVLKRSPNGVGAGRWCSGPLMNQKGETLDSDVCASWGDINVVEPGPAGEQLKSLVSELLGDEALRSRQCKSQ
ncbi:hypothetical protein QJS10_CPB18g00108 [Acorus calamus]|uniref:Uncharacterized protein n=1 Tax=Acorus calamus TaxID=4465 RepID=A0AAV9CN26_ACOCL|nr:hypothetical protein QJS10_CPB18g00108 [Acorus calamus]